MQDKTVTNSHTAGLHTQIKLFRNFPQPSRYPQLPTVTLLPSTHKSSRSVPFLSPVGTHSYQQSHCCPPHTNQAVPYLSSAQSVPTVTNSHTAALHTQIKLFRNFPQPSRYPQLPTVTLLPSTHTNQNKCSAPALSCTPQTAHFQKLHFASKIPLSEGKAGNHWVA